MSPFHVEDELEFLERDFGVEAGRRRGGKTKGRVSLRDHRSRKGHDGGMCRYGEQ